MTHSSRPPRLFFPTSFPPLSGFINSTTSEVNSILSSIPSPPTSDLESVEGEVCRIILADITKIGEAFDCICKLDAVVNREKVGVRYVGEGRGRGGRRRRLRNFVLGDDLRLLVEEGRERTKEEIREAREEREGMGMVAPRERVLFGRAKTEEEEEEEEEEGREEVEVVEEKRKGLKDVKASRPSISSRPPPRQPPSQQQPLPPPTTETTEEIERRFEER